MPAIRKFVAKIILGDEGCWLWTASLRRGYGQFGLGKKNMLAHRASYILYKGDIPDGLVVRHTCDVKHCVNPRHLVLGTHKENVRDCIQRGRRSKGGWAK